ncbi:hypothetical protein GBA52_026384 [Prunus armeniaca]|nr:hypothetical protein GBA52_026384 [Prunus armeniaca]
MMQYLLNEPVIKPKLARPGRVPVTTCACVAGGVGDGSIRVWAECLFTSKGLSSEEALVCVARPPRKQSIDDFEAKPLIHNPHVQLYPYLEISQAVRVRAFSPFTIYLFFPNLCNCRKDTHLSKGA